MDLRKDHRKYEMIKYSACAGKTRPHYCKYDTNMCCFGCDKNEECLHYAKVTKSMRPCGINNFIGPDEICEFAI